MNRLLTLIISIGAALSLTANDETFRAMLIEHTDGSVTSINLQEKMSYTFDADRITITTTREEVKLPAEYVRSIRYTTEGGGTTTGIGNTISRTVSIKGSIMQIEGFPPDAVLQLYDVRGVKVNQCTLDEDIVRIDLSNLPNGLYVANLMDMTFKILLP